MQEPVNSWSPETDSSRFAFDEIESEEALLNISVRDSDSRLHPFNVNDDASSFSGSSTTTSSSASSSSYACTQTRHVTSSNLTTYPFSESLVGINADGDSLFSLLPAKQMACTGHIVTQQSWTKVSQSPAVAFLSRFSPSEEMLSSWTRLFDEDMNIRDNSVIQDKYIIGKTISQGEITECREGISILGTGQPSGLVVLKIAKFLPFTESAQKLTRVFTKEISIWKTLQHPNILPLQDLITCPGMIVAISPMASDGDLLRLSQRNNGLLSVLTIRKIMHQIAKALAYLHHEKSLIHKDVKLENILIESTGRAYLCDFGLSDYIKLSPSLSSGSSNGTCKITSRINEKCSSTVKCICSCVKCSTENTSFSGDPDQEQAQSFCTGSLFYCPPEEIVPSLKQEIADCNCEKVFNGPKTDIWAFGVCLYALACGRFPFVDEFIPRLQKKVQAGIYDPITFLHDGTEQELISLNNLISNCLKVDRNDRLDINQVLSSEFFSVSC